ncbi:MAG: hypothetical protein AABX73_01290 [Nanoarchaeota archaeon]
MGVFFAKFFASRPAISNCQIDDAKSYGIKPNLTIKRTHVGKGLYQYKVTTETSVSE